MTVEIRTGAIELLAKAVRENPAAPSLDAYLGTLDLSADEKARIVESVKVLNDAVLSPADSPIPQVVNKWD